MAGCLAGGLAGRPAGWLADWLAARPAGRLAGRAASLLAGWPAGWPADLLAGPAGWPASRLATLFFFQRNHFFVPRNLPDLCGGVLNGARKRCPKGGLLDSGGVRPRARLAAGCPWLVWLGCLGDLGSAGLDWDWAGLAAALVKVGLR